MSRRTVSLLLSAAAWLGFNAIMLWTVAFLADVVVPRTVDGPARTSTQVAITVDLTLLLLFALQHSVMARRPVKAWLGRRIPATMPIGVSLPVRLSSRAAKMPCPGSLACVPI